MDGVQDLFDPRQIALFDAIDELSSNVASDIEIPQLIVVGDQKVGKSSVLEAIARFRFPVHESLCTRFPTKLILRRSAEDSEERIKISIEPGDSRTEDEKNELRKFTESLTKPEDLSTYMEKASAVLGVLPPSSVADPPPVNLHGPPSNSDEDHRKFFTDDVLKIEKQGPNMPLLSLVDLPGLFQAESTEQDEASKETVMRMVEKHIERKRSLILLVISAQIPYHIHTGLATIQRIRKSDVGLADRVVGVITKPDQAINIGEIFGILEGRLDLTGGRIRWHVVKNQGNNERQQTLEQRDANEEQFFLESSWKEVPENQRGIKALRKTLKEILWTHIRRELPGLVTEVQERIAFVKAGCAAAERSRATDEARREYLCEIARRFEGLVREASKGTYWNERCKVLHMIDESCQVCKGFFPSFDSDDSVSQAKKLRSNIRSLSKSFAFAMEKFGKTKVIEDSFSTTDSTSDAMAQEFPVQDIIEKYYTHDNPDSVGRKPHEEWVATQIERWRAGEPQGEASEAVYTGLFRYQSMKWPNIALRHLQAIWKAIKDFIRLALDAACIDHDIREALRKDLIQPSLDTLEKESYRTLRDLLNCHERGNSGFYNGFVNIQQFMRIQAEDIAERLATLASEHIGLREQGASDKLFEHIHKDLRHLLSLPTNGSLANGIFHSIIAGKVNSIITQAFEWADDKKDEGDYAVREATHFELIPSALKNITAARVIEHVETYYEMSMVAFVGYVNSLVVENGILHELPDALLTAQIIMGTDEEKIQEIAGEKEADVQARLQNEQNLKELTRILETLKRHLV